MAKALGKSVRDVTVVLLDRPRHSDLIAEVRASGARMKLLEHGDVGGAISTAWPDSGVDILLGIGGTPEGVLAAAALKCMGGMIQGRLWPRDEAERAAAIGAGYDLDEILVTDTLVQRQQLLLRYDRDHRRRAAPGRPVPRLRRHDAVTRDAIDVGNRTVRHRAPRAAQARRVQPDRVRLTLDTNAVPALNRKAEPACSCRRGWRDRDPCESPLP